MMTKIKEIIKSQKKFFIPIVCMAAALACMGAGYALAKGTVERSKTEVSGGVYAANGSYRSQGEESAGTLQRKGSLVSEIQTKRQEQSLDIGLEAAKEKALADAGLSAADVTFTKEKKDMDDGIYVYDLEFYTAEMEYDYEINAATGAVHDKSMETIPAAGQNQGSGQNQNQGGSQGQDNAQNQGSGQGQQTDLIGLEAAKEKVLADAGLSAADVTFTKESLDYDNGVSVYDIEFYTQTMEYDYEIHGITGAILEKSTEAFYGNGGQSGSAAGTGDTASYIGVDQAKSIALGHAGFSASEVTFSKAKLENDDGQTVYEVEFYKDGVEYEYTIEAATGTILEYDSDWDD